MPYVYFFCGSVISFSSWAQVATFVCPSPEGPRCCDWSVIHAPVSAKLLPLPSNLEVAWSALEYYELVFVEPRRSSAVEHVFENFCSFRVKQLGNSGDMEILPAIVDYFKVAIVEHFAVDCVFHNILVICSFRFHYSGFINLNAGVGRVQKSAEGFDPSTFQVW